MSTSDGYRVTLSALADAANDLTGQAQQLTTAAGKITGTTLEPAAFGQLPVSAEVAEKHDKTVRTASQTTTTAGRRTTTLATGLTNSATGYRDTDQTVAESYQALMNGSTVPPVSSGSSAFASQIATNQTEVASALTQLQAQLAQLRSP